MLAGVNNLLAKPAIQEQADLFFPALFPPNQLHFTPIDCVNVDWWSWWWHFAAKDSINFSGNARTQESKLINRVTVLQYCFIAFLVNNTGNFFFVRSGNRMHCLWQIGTLSNHTLASVNLENFTLHCDAEWYTTELQTKRYIFHNVIALKIINLLFISGC